MARFTTEILSQEFPRLFDEFEALVGNRWWLKRARAIEEEIKGKPLLKGFLLRENRIAFVLRELTEQKRNLGTLPDMRFQSKGQFDAYALVAQFMQLYRTLPHQEAKALVGRLRGAFANLDDLRALQFEWMIATHLVKRGYDVDLPRVDQGTHDLLASRAGELFDVECKSISNDKGRQIHERDALELFSLLQKASGPFARRLQTGLLVRITVPKRLPSSHQARQAMCDQINRAILSGQDLREVELEVSLYDFDVLASPLVTHPPDMAAVRTFFESRFGIVDRQLAIAYSNSGRALAFCIESKMPDRMLDAMIATAKEACDHQLTGERPGVICLKFEGVTADELAEVGDETGQPSPLRIATSALLNSRRDSHLVCLGYFADGFLIKHSDGGVSQEGRTYFFENETSPHHSSLIVPAFRAV
jgi:hypothetical protein